MEDRGREDDVCEEKKKMVDIWGKDEGLGEGKRKGDLIYEKGKEVREREDKESKERERREEKVKGSKAR